MPNNYNDLTVREAINKLVAGVYVLPSIQREFVWERESIESLFDSLMKGYPIGSFLFWKISNEGKNNYKFYKFISDYTEKESFNLGSTKLDGVVEPIAVLDGQQRLTSLYIGLKGSYEARKKYAKKDSYLKQYLYLGLLNEDTERDDFKFNFRFMCEGDAEAQDAAEATPHYWFRVGKILDIVDMDKAMDYLDENNLHDIKFARKTLSRLCEIIHTNGLISFWQENDADLDKALNIFVRVNSGGKKLSYADLLLSVITGQWDDAREKFSKAVIDLRDIGNGFRGISKDFLLKTDLILCDSPDIAFKAANFKSSIVEKIRENWDKMIEATRLTLELVSSFGFSDDNIVSYNALIPITHYIYLNNNPNIVFSAEFADDRSKIKKWFVSASLQRFMSGSSDTTLDQLRKIIRDHHEGFPLEEILRRYRGSTRDLEFTDDNIDAILNETRYKDANATIILSLLSNEADLSGYSVDHIYPQAGFNNKQYSKMGLTDEQKKYYEDRRNRLANLQLLKGPVNQGKSDTAFVDWVKSVYPTADERNAYMVNNLIPNVNLDFSNFEEFVGEREKLIREKLKRMLPIKSE